VGFATRLAVGRVKAAPKLFGASSEADPLPGRGVMVRVTETTTHINSAGFP
jgi:hypothetical protein